MKKRISRLETLLQENMVHQLYDGIKVKLYTRGRHMREGETQTFDVTMVQDYEELEGVEVIHETYKRNPKVFKGVYINVHRDKQGHYQVHLKKMEMDKYFNPFRVGNAIITELLTAKKVLGL